MKLPFGDRALIPHEKVERYLLAPDHGPEEGDVGKVVHRYGDGRAFEVEFLAGDGSTLAVLILEPDEVRHLERADRFHVRTAPGD